MSEQALDFPSHKVTEPETVGKTIVGYQPDSRVEVIKLPTIERATSYPFDPRLKQGLGSQLFGLYRRPLFSRGLESALIVAGCSFLTMYITDLDTFSET